MVALTQLRACVHIGRYSELATEITLAGLKQPFCFCSVCRVANMSLTVLTHALTV